MTLTLVKYPNKILETKADEVTEFGTELKKLCDDMHAFLETNGGIGLAANQVGISKQVLVIHIPYSADKYAIEKERYHDRKFTIINPKIVSKKGRTTAREGCLSFPGLYDWVPRGKEVIIEGKDIEGRWMRLGGYGLLAICLQHEIDHLNGKVFIDRMSAPKRAKYKKLLKKEK